MAERENNDKATAANQYSVYVNRDTQATQVNWGQIAKDLTTGANAIRDGREAKKQAITDATNKALNDLAQIADVDNQSLGKLLINGSDYSKKTLMANMELLRNGGLDPKDYQLIMQSQLDGYKNLSLYAEGADEKYQEAMKRLELGEDGQSIASDMEMTWNEGTFGFGNLRNKRLITNPRNGELVLVTMEDDGTGNLVMPDPETNPEAFQNTAYINVATDFKLDRRNTNVLADNITENLADVISSTAEEYSVLSGGGQITSISDFRQLFDIEDPEGKSYMDLRNDDNSKMTYDQFMSDQVDSITGDKSDLSSMNAMQVLTGAGYKMVQSEDEAKKKGISKYVIYKNVNGRPEIQLTPDQMQKARNIAKRAIESRIDLKIKQTQEMSGQQKKSPTPVDVGIADRDQKASNLYSTVGKFVTGDPNESSSAATTLANIYNNQRGERPEITGQIERVIGDIQADGKAKVTYRIPFSDGIQEIDARAGDGSLKTPTMIVEEMYDIVNPYKSDVTIARSAFTGKLGDNINYEAAIGKIKFKTIEKIDFAGDVQIDGAVTTPATYLENQLGENLDDGQNAESQEIETSVTNIISQLMPQVMFDNVTFTVEASDADGGESIVTQDADGNDVELKKGYVIINFDVGGQTVRKLIQNTNNMSSAKLLSEVESAMEDARVQYNKNEKPL